MTVPVFDPAVLGYGFRPPTPPPVWGAVSLGLQGMRRSQRQLEERDCSAARRHIDIESPSHPGRAFPHISYSVTTRPLGRECIFERRRPANESLSVVADLQ